MVMPTRSSPASTIEELLALPEDHLRHELLDGLHVVTPAPRLSHQAVLSQFSYVLGRGLEGCADLVLLTSPADIILGSRTLVQPDLFVIRKPANMRLARWSDAGVPVLAIEFLSPNTAARDRGAKRRIYQQAGVAEYWIVDLDAQLVERWRPTDERPQIVTDILLWDPGTGMTSAAIDLPNVFRQALGDQS